MRKFWCVLAVILVLLLGAARADEIVRGGVGEDVTRLQERLVYLGFLDGKIDGKYGPATSAAVSELKKLINARYGVSLDENGDTADAVTLGYLYAADTRFFVSALKEGDSGFEVTRLQRALRQAGYLTDASVTGAFDSVTRRAVSACQVENGVPVSGNADEGTLSLLYGLNRKTSAYSCLVYGDSSEAVMTLQNHLYRLGYLSKEPDGQFGSGTRDALALYMQDAFGEADGGSLADAWTQITLKNGTFAYKKTYEQGDSDPAVERLERLLIRYGYYDGLAERELTGDAAIALQYFQQTNRLPVTSKADRDTQELLFSGRAQRVTVPAPRTVRMGDTGPNVLEFQQNLVRLGLLNLPINGRFDDGTQTAAGKALTLLSASGTDVTGWAEGDARLLMLLKNDAVPFLTKMTVGDTGDEVVRLQARLHSLGYLSRLRVDGKYGEVTQNAIRAFQKENGLTETGNADRRLQEALYSQKAIERKTAYRINVSIDEQQVYIYKLQSDLSYALVRTMTCSTGLNDATPRGVFCGTTGAGARWHYFEEFDCWAQYAFFIEHDIMFHSVIYSKQDETTLRQSSVTALGHPASHGCVRLSLADAEWIYTTCPAGTVVTIY